MADNVVSIVPIPLFEIRTLMEEESARLRRALAVLECAHTVLEECAGDDRDSADPGITGPADAMQVAMKEIIEAKAALDLFLEKTAADCEDCKEEGALPHSWHQ